MNTTYRTVVGVSPSGVTWIAYRPEHVEPMLKRLAQVWARHDSHEARAAEREAGRMKRWKD